MSRLSGLNTLKPECEAPFMLCLGYYFVIVGPGAGQAVCSECLLLLK